MAGAKPYGQLQYKEIAGKRMAYVDEGRGEQRPLPPESHGGQTPDGAAAEGRT